MRKIVQFIAAVVEALLGVGRIEDRFGGTPMQVDFADLAEDVAPVVEKRAADFAANPRQAHGKAKFLVEDEQRLTANREAGDGIARASLVQSEAAQGSAAAGEETLRKGNDAGKGLD